MRISSKLSSPHSVDSESSSFWFAKHSKSIIFIIIALALAGVYVAFTLPLVDAALSRVQSTLPSTATITANRLTFASFPILGYSLTSANIPQTQLWEMATYEMKPRLNRLEGVSTVVIQGGQEPEFHIVPDPAKLLQTSITV